MPNASGVNGLLALVGTASAPATADAETLLVGEEAWSGQAFAQLLSEFGAGGGQGQWAQHLPHGQLLPSQVAGNVSGALAAQDLNLTALVAQPSPMDKVITPEDAAALIKQLDALMGQVKTGVGNGGKQTSQGENHSDAEVAAQIKQQLQQIVRDDAPKTLGTIVAAVPALHEKKLSLSLLQIFSRFNANHKSQAEHESEEEPGRVLTVMQQLPATVFRPVSRENSATSSTATEQEAKSNENLDGDTVMVLQPLVYATVVKPAEGPANMTDNATSDVSLQAITPLDLDQRIPLLGDAGDQHATVNSKATGALPDVTLPKMQALAQATPANVTAAANAAQNASEQKNDAPVRDDFSALSMRGIDADQSAGITYPHAIASTSHTNTASHSSKFVDMVPTQGYLNNAPVSDQVHVAIHQARKDGMDRITIQLEPVELGRIEVNMTTSRDGLTQIQFTVDNSDTFDHLSRDARHLERSLQEAGIKADTGSMQFNLRQQPQPQMQSGLGGQGQPQGQQEAENDNESTQASVTNIMPTAAFTRHYTINVREGVDISA